MMVTSNGKTGVGALDAPEHSEGAASAVSRRALLFAAVFLLATLRAAPAELPPDMARILEARKIVVAMHSEDFAPFFMHDAQGQLFGLDVELAYDIARKLGVDLVLNRSARTFDELVDIVADRQADMAISDLSITVRRALEVDFSDPYLKLRHGALINRLKSPQRASLDWLNSMDVVIGVEEGTSYAEFAERDYPAARIVQHPTWERSIEAILGGEVHALLFDETRVYQWVRDYPENALYVRTKILEDKVDAIGIAVHSQDRHLLHWLDLYIHTAEEDGTLDKLKDVYVRGDTWRREMGLPTDRGLSK